MLFLAEVSLAAHDVPCLFEGSVHESLSGTEKPLGFPDPYACDGVLAQDGLRAGRRFHVCQFLQCVERVPGDAEHHARHEGGGHSDERQYVERARLDWLLGKPTGTVRWHEQILHLVVVTPGAAQSPTCHVSIISTPARGKKRSLNSGVPRGVSRATSPSRTRQPPSTHVLCVIPLPNDQRPVSLYPPSTAHAVPLVASEPAMITSWSAKISRREAPQRPTLANSAWTRSRPPGRG